MFNSRKDYELKIKNLEAEVRKYKFKSDVATIGEEIGVLIKEIEDAVPDNYTRSKIIQEMLVLAGMISSESLSIAHDIWKGRIDSK